MSATATNVSNNGSDHQLNTLTDVIRIAGETRSDVKVIDSKVDRLEQKVDSNQRENCERFDRLEQKVERLEQKVDQKGSDISEIKETLQLILSKLPQ